MLKARAPLVLDLPNDAWFDVGLMQKDIRLALGIAGELGVPLASARAANEALSLASELGFEHRDITALFQALARNRPARPSLRAEGADAGPVSRTVDGVDGE